ncbi:MAG: transposase-like zinc-binding domain-containing protein [Microcystaceae cyanobacterium]
MNGRIGIMKCLSCHSTELRKNGRRYDKQCFQCKHCGR